MTESRATLKLVDTSPLPQLESRVVVPNGPSMSMREASEALASAKQIMSQLAHSCDIANAWLQKYFCE